MSVAVTVRMAGISASARRPVRGWGAVFGRVRKVERKGDCVPVSCIIHRAQLGSRVASSCAPWPLYLGRTQRPLTVTASWIFAFSFPPPHIFSFPFISLSLHFISASLSRRMPRRIHPFVRFLPPLRSILRVTKPFVRPATRLAPQQCRTSLIIPRQVHHSWGWPLCRNNFYEERSNVRGFLGKLIYNSFPPPPRQERLVSTRRRNFEQYNSLHIIFPYLYPKNRRGRSKVFKKFGCRDEFRASLVHVSIPKN